MVAPIFRARIGTACASVLPSRIRSSQEVVSADATLHGWQLSCWSLSMMRKSEKTREKILDTALTLFRKQGFDGTTMRDVAKQAGVALGAAYYYFPSKEALVMAYYERIQDDHLA